MEIKKELTQGFFTGERALFGERNLRVTDSVFDAGESPLKECADLVVLQKRGRGGLHLV